MSDVVLTRDESGKLAGMGAAGERAYARFLAAVRGLEIGATLRFSFWLPRSVKHHGLFFRKLDSLFGMQEQFDDEEKLRKWLIVGAGYCDFLPGPTGRMVAIPQSMAWHQMDEAEFCEVHQRIDQFMWTPHARRFLWPHLDDAVSLQMVEAWRREFDR